MEANTDGAGPEPHLPSPGDDHLGLSRLGLTDLPYFIPHQDFRRRPKLQLMDVINALVASRGNIAQAARVLSRPRQHIRNFIDRHVDCQKLLLDLRATLLDDAEFNYARAVELGHLEASKFVLQTFGKDRGYKTPGVTASAQDSAGNKVKFTIET